MPYESFLFSLKHSVLAPVLGPRTVTAGRIVLATTDSRITSYSAWQLSWAPTDAGFPEGCLQLAGHEGVQARLPVSAEDVSVAVNGDSPFSFSSWLS